MAHAGMYGEDSRVQQGVVSKWRCPCLHGSAD